MIRNRSTAGRMLTIVLMAFVFVAEARADEQKLPLACQSWVNEAVAFVREKAHANPSAFIGKKLVFAETFVDAPEGIRSWHIRVDGSAIEGGVSVPGDVQRLIVVDFSIATRIAPIIYQDNPDGVRLRDDLVREALTTRKLAEHIYVDGAKELSAELLEGLHDHMATRVDTNWQARCDAGPPPAATDIGKQSWYPSEYGADDSIGAANNLSSEGVIAASRLIQSGKTYPLGIVSDETLPVHGGRWYRMSVFHVGPFGANAVTGHDDLVNSFVGVGTQIDGLGHIGINGVHYNGVPDSAFYRQSGLTKFGAESIPPIVTRGVLLDFVSQNGGKTLSDSQVITRDMIMDAARAQKVELRRGDVVLLHTGWMNVMTSDPDRYINLAPGLGEAGAEYLAGLGVVAIGSDTSGLEVSPAERADQGVLVPVHQLLLAKHGVYILEYVNTRDLAEDRAYEFMFVLGQPRLRGSVQAIVNPIAIR